MRQSGSMMPMDPFSLGRPTLEDASPRACVTSSPAQAKACFVMHLPELNHWIPLRVRLVCSVGRWMSRFFLLTCVCVILQDTELVLFSQKEQEVLILSLRQKAGDGHKSSGSLVLLATFMCRSSLVA